MRKSPARLRAWCTSIPRAGQAPNPIPRLQDGRTARSAPQSSPSSHREWHEPPLYATSTRCEPKVPFFMAAPAARYFLLSSIGFGYVFELLTNGCEIPLEFKAARPDHCRPCTHRLSKPVLDASVQRASSRERDRLEKNTFWTTKNAGITEVPSGPRHDELSHSAVYQSRPGSQWQDPCARLELLRVQNFVKRATVALRLTTGSVLRQKGLYF